MHQQCWQENWKTVYLLAILSNQLTSQIIGIFYSILAQFRFTCQSIHFIGQAGSRVDQLTCLVYKLAGKQTSQNIYDCSNA